MTLTGPSSRFKGKDGKTYSESVWHKVRGTATVKTRVGAMKVELYWYKAPRSDIVKLEVKKLLKSFGGLVVKAKRLGLAEWMEFT